MRPVVAAPYLFQLRLDARAHLNRAAALLSGRLQLDLSFITKGPLFCPVNRFGKILESRLTAQRGYQVWPPQQFAEHYLAERYHQWIGSQLIQSRLAPSNDNGRGVRSGAGHASAEFSSSTIGRRREAAQRVLGDYAFAGFSKLPLANQQQMQSVLVARREQTPDISTMRDSAAQTERKATPP